MRCPVPGVLCAVPWHVVSGNGSRKKETMHEGDPEGKDRSVHSESAAALPTRQRGSTTTLIRAPKAPDATGDDPDEKDDEPPPASRPHEKAGHVAAAAEAARDALPTYKPAVFEI